MKSDRMPSPANRFKANIHVFYNPTEDEYVTTLTYTAKGGGLVGRTLVDETPPYSMERPTAVEWGGSVKECILLLKAVGFKGATMLRTPNGLTEVFKNLEDAYGWAENVLKSN